MIYSKLLTVMASIYTQEFDIVQRLSSAQHAV
jgi:hypothetical protein